MNEGPQESRPNDRRLETWKEIAAYLQRDLRTVQRWERREGLPVRRHLHAEGVTVYAYAGDLDEWWRHRHPTDSPVPELEEAVSRQPSAGAETASRHWWRLLPASMTIVSVVAIAAVVVWLFGTRSPAPLSADSAPSVTRLFANVTREGASPVRIPVPRSSIGGVLLPNGREIYVADPASEAVLVVDTTVRSIVHRIPIPGQPAWITLSPDGRYAYVSGQTGSVVVVRTSDRTATTIKVDGMVSGVLPTPDGRFVYLASPVAGLFRLQVGANTLQRLPVVGCPMYVARDDFKMYVSFQCEGSGGRPGHDAVGVFDLVTGQMIGQMQGPPQVGGPLAASPDGAFVWMNGSDACMATYYDHAGCPEVPAGIVNIFRATDNTLARSLPFSGAQPSNLAFLPGGLRVFVGAATPRVLDAHNFSVSETVPHVAPSLPMFDGTARAAWLIVDGSLVRLTPLTADCDIGGAGLVHLWPADGSADDVHNGMHGEARNGVGFVPGMVGQALAFDGREAEVRLDASEDASVESGDATVVAWVKFSSIEGEMPLIDRTTGPGPRGYGWRIVKSADQHIVFSMQPRRVGAEPQSRFQAQSETRVEAGRWYHVAMTRRMGVTSLYVNGRREAESGTEVAPPTGAIEMRLGHDADGHTLHGLLDEIAEYARGLTPAEIARIYRNAAAPACTGK